MYAVELKNIIYVVGGYVPGTGRVGTVYAYNPTTDTWTEEAPLEVGKSSPATVAFGSKILAAGELGNSGFLSDNDVYNSTKNSWKTLASYPYRPIRQLFWRNFGTTICGRRRRSGSARSCGILHSDIALAV